MKQFKTQVRVNYYFESCPRNKKKSEDLVSLSNLHPKSLS